MLGDDGAGLDIALAEVLPWFLVLTRAFSVGLMEAVTGRDRRPHLVHPPRAPRPDARRAAAGPGRSCPDADRDRPGGRRSWPTRSPRSRAGRDDAMLRVLEVKAAAGEAAIEVTDLAMKVCGGAAFRKELGVERRFRDARAARVMAPTTDALLDFVGRAINGLPLLR